MHPGPDYPLAALNGRSDPLAPRQAAVPERFGSPARHKPTRALRASVRHADVFSNSARLVRVSSVGPRMGHDGRSGAGPHSGEGDDDEDGPTNEANGSRS